MEVINLGNIADLKKATITNAIISHYGSNQTQLLQSINIKEIGLNYAKAEVITSFFDLQVIKHTSTIRFCFTPLSLQLHHIITNRNIRIKPSANIRNTIIPALRHLNNQYYNDSVWNEIRLINHDIQYWRNKNANTINFQQFLWWNSALDGIKNNDRVPINVSIRTLELHKLPTINNLGNLGELEIVTAAVLQRFQQLNPWIDITNLKVTEIRENSFLLDNNRSYKTITGSAVITSSDNINFDHDIYTNGVTITFSYRQRIQTNETDLQKIANSDQTNSKKTLN